MTVGCPFPHICNHTSPIQSQPVLQLATEEHLLAARAVLAGLCADFSPAVLDALELLAELLLVLAGRGGADGDEDLGAVELAGEGGDGPGDGVGGAKAADLGDVGGGEVVTRVGAAGGDGEGGREFCAFC